MRNQPGGSRGDRRIDVSTIVLSPLLADVRYSARYKVRSMLAV
jgi:hypothetical protein